MYKHPEDYQNFILDLEPYFMFINNIIKSKGLRIEEKGIYINNKRDKINLTDDLAIVDDKNIRHTLNLSNNLIGYGKTITILDNGSIIYTGINNPAIINTSPILPVFPAMILEVAFDNLQFGLNPYKEDLLRNRLLNLYTPYVHEDVSINKDTIDIVFDFLGEWLDLETIKKISRVYDDILLRIITPILEERPECVYDINLKTDRSIIIRKNDVRAMRWQELISYKNENEGM